MSTGPITATDESSFLREETSLFDEDWKSCGVGDALEGLGAVVDFNAGFHFENDGLVDPLLLSIPSTPTGASGTPFIKASDHQGGKSQSLDLDPAFWSDFEGSTGSCDVSTFEQVGTGTEVMMHNTSNRKKAPNGPLNYNRSQAFHLQPRSTPDFYPSIEFPASSTPGHQFYDHHTHAIMFPNHNHHHLLSRRSVSEPPSGPTYDNPTHIHYRYASGHATTPQPEVVFHRPGHFIGTREPLSDGMTEMKRLPKRRNQLSNKRVGSKPSPVRQRPEIKRTRTQPARGVTSAPASPRGMDTPRRKAMNSQMEESWGVALSLREGTPTSVPDVGSVASSLVERKLPKEDPASQGVSGKEGAFWISMSAERLQGLITEAVRDAFGNSKAGCSDRMVEAQGFGDDGATNDIEGSD